MHSHLLLQIEKERSGKHVVDVAVVAAVAAAVVVAVDDAAVIAVAVVGLQRISGGLWRLHWGDGYCCGAEKGL